MSLMKSCNNVSKVVLLVLILASQTMSSHSTPLTMHRRYLLHSATAASAATTKGMIEGTITPTEGGGFAGATDDVRPTNPGHSPGIGHAFINNKFGRKLLLTVDHLLSHGNGAAPKGMVEGVVFPSLAIHGDKGPMVDVDDVRTTNWHSSCTYDPNSNGLRCTSAATTKGMIEGTITPTEGGGFAGATDDVRPTNPGHSPGIGPVITNNKFGRKLLLTVDQY